MTTASLASPTDGIAIEGIEEPEDPVIPSGTVLVGRYAIERMLGRGGMGTVYLAEHVEIGRKVAVKLLASHWCAHQALVRRFRAEARTASAIGHPNIVQVFDAGTLPDGRLYLVMEYLAGRDLWDELQLNPRLDPLRACEIAAQVADALGAAHRAGVVHRDIKPSNLMLVSFGGQEQVKVLDFGIAANTAGLAPGQERLTDPGSLIGTPEYMAPEQATGEPATPAFDVYALGAVLFASLVGHPPFTAVHTFELLTLKTNQPAPSLEAFRPDLPPSLVALVDACLRMAPGERPPDGDAVARRLEGVLEDLRRGAGPSEQVLPDTSPPPGQPEPAAAPPAAPPVLTEIAAAAEPRRRGVARRLALVAGGLALSASAVTAAVWTAEPEPAVEPPSTSQTADANPLSAPPERSPPAAPLAERAAAPTPAPEPARSPEDALPTPSGPTLAAASPVPGRPSPGAPTISAKPPRIAADAHLTPRCERVRTTAEESRRSQRWASLRDASRQQECWASAVEARKLQTKALMELGDFTGCMSVGKGLKDQEVRGWITLCKKRAGG